MEKVGKVGKVGKIETKKKLSHVGIVSVKVDFVGESN